MLAPQRAICRGGGPTRWLFCWIYSGTLRSLVDLDHASIHTVLVGIRREHSAALGCVAVPISPRMTWARWLVPHSRLSPSSLGEHVACCSVPPSERSAPSRLLVRCAIGARRG